MLKNQKAFTLIELVLVIAILGVLSLAYVTMSPSTSTAELTVAARQVESDIFYTQQRAMVTGVTHGVQFVSGGDYTMYQSTTSTPITHPLGKQSAVITLSDKYSGVSIQNNYTVEFNSFGTATTGGGSSVTLTDGSNTVSISVNANTGRASIN